ncbi:endoribonuclease L-PSP [Liquorilactobacillus sucicola DSM 21376 = JCM 15457]|uniref:Endoribonuclease L-PSP n=1 Tax=Liquorilactobacillus sucicola DSM 21376 = JCM 15457 TaxID=1423806 RepID=A0A023CXT6_9LACO|nr:Rid family detoxifying hydrolase [Liquorilactobacillus sucicola]KRN07671.1 endoribonuclease L-PSP [Liquorilactobacillus sucicola DSM 21376 = JCM 15457]GAJ26693.1 endoribonuclease L-PSP [Liquorilactobacillus sucicola DSM 21376 = JCM 15457]
MKKTITTDMAPHALGPYSQGVEVNKVLYCSGQIGIDPQKGKLAGVSVVEQAKQALQNIKAIVVADSLSVADIVKVTVFMTNIADFSKVNEIYAEFFKDAPLLPARSAVGVQALPAEAKIEIEAIAAKHC